MSENKRKMWRVVLVVLVLLVAFRLSLPYIVTRYVNKKLNQNKDFSVTIGEVDVNLYRLAYEIDSITIRRAHQKQPHIIISHTDVCLDWESIFNGSVVNQVIINKPVIILDYANRYETKLISNHKGRNIRKIIEDITPFQVNRITINDGKFILNSARKQQPGIIFSSIQADITNLLNVKDNPEPLPSRLYVQALSAGNGQLNIVGKFNIEGITPALEMDIKFDQVQLSEINQFIQEKYNINYTSGILNMYSKIALHNNEITGYITPNFQNANVIRHTDRSLNLNPLELSIQHIMLESAKRKESDDIKIPITGSLISDAPFLTSLETILTESFAGYADHQTRNTYSTASTTSVEKPVVEPEALSKKEIRKERRLEKKEERKKLRRERRERRKN